MAFHYSFCFLKIEPSQKWTLISFHKLINFHRTILLVENNVVTMHACVFSLHCPRLWLYVISLPRAQQMSKQPAAISVKAR